MKFIYQIEQLFHKLGWVLSKPPIYSSAIHKADSWTADYVRVLNLELMAYTLKQKNLEGAVAEVGVYKGEFSAKINQVFPNQTFYLFDTFEGFNSNDIAIEKEKKLSDGTQNFSNTSVHLVMSKMKNPKNCIIKKGYFPESAQGVNDNFIFVSLDTDLYQPIWEGLNFFYPKLLQGGYIMIHDYNNPQYPGVKEAVDKFCFPQHISNFPIADRYGSIVITK